ncbi:TlpA disulfide reductase family protein [Aquimarina sp. 2201CG14-23]|uniref:TlpA disulfide reductase family protein n=1 Tax=Aquimarina mycalae TaxID=3040073 RepID=UPI0024781E1B|nr:TlpA disulfide reductase family protein [Aquimarina sp. 2201CG14-23]MDH7443999.1 TlpA disulfide reductase family protein [Aquimarina sp. 2201CG14-23]
MKKIVLLAIILLSVACQKEEKGYSISAETEGFDDGVTVYVNAINQSNRPTIIDSTTIKEGKFKIALPPIESNDLNYLTFKDVPGNVLYLGENNPIKMTIYKDSMRSSIIKGGSENQLFFSYLRTMNAYGKERQELSNQYQIASKLKEADKALQLSAKLEEVRTNEKEYRKEIAVKNPNSLVAVMALTDLLNLKAAPAKQIKKIYATVEDTLKTSRLGKNLDRLIQASVGKIDIGSEAEDFSAPNPEGQLVSLKESMGKITIIDFWASWCKPCRAENPNVVRVYNKYHDKGLNIIGVSLDRNKDHWTKAITQDNLDWNHVSHLKFWQDPIAKAYGVRSIPATFILDEKGNVIAKNLRGPALESRISELLGKESL